MNFIQSPIKSICALIILSAVMIFITACQLSNITATDFWARIVPAGQGVGAIYGVIDNPTDNNAVIVNAMSPLAGRIELHTHSVDEAGIMRMRRVPEMVVKAKNKMTLKPGSLHIMLFDLADNIEVGQSYPLTLTFDDATNMTIDVVVKPLSYAPENK